MGKLTIIKHVRVFDGDGVSGPRTAVIDGSHIGDDELADEADPSAVTVVDGTGCTLLPGLIDCHVHIRDTEQLASCASYGVTTEHSRHGVLFKFAGATTDHAVHNTDEAEKFVQDRVNEGVDYIKIIADEPGHEQAVLDRIQVEARKHGKLTVAHVARYKSFERGLRAGFNILTHVPMDKALDDGIVNEMISQRVVAVPTLTMMETMANSWILWGISWILPSLGRNMNFQAALNSVRAMRDAGIPILAGTDVNNSGVVSVAAGESLHHELELLVRAGLNSVEALRATTSLAAQHFNLQDRGRIRPGLRADLVLVNGHPDEDITATRRIVRVWSGGGEVTHYLQRKGGR
ncbi:hypothetical protein AAE478_005384 [Parahypoxylon ruwenzoriense]